MKQVIENKMYNTETAKEVASYSNGYGWNDFRHICETLYRKRTGEFFLYGCGGAMTIYGTPCGNSRTGGEEITPLPDCEAKMWVMKHCDVNTYITLFGEVEE